MTTSQDQTHRASCINYAIIVIAENNLDTQASDERDGTTTEMTPETPEQATLWLDDGNVECHCGEDEFWHAIWDHKLPWESE